MSSDRLPANTNEPPFAANLWAAWPGGRSCVAAWSTLAYAGIGNWLMLQEALLKAGGDLMRTQLPTGGALPAADDAPAIDVFSAAAEDVRDCSEAVMQAQFDALEALRRPA
ncbi:MAG: hypothetical protein IV086_19245 [Hyphomonadaceae bacterium]|nr:hypothetical protein [Hyphomonadaceae bacterium]